MKKDVLRKCIDGLKALKSSKHGTLDASVVAELDTVISQLELCLDAGDDVKIDAGLSLRVLKILSDCIECATNLSELINRFFDSN